MLSDVSDIMGGGGGSGPITGKGDVSLSIESLVATQSSSTPNKKKSTPAASTGLPSKRPDGMAQELWRLLDRDKPNDVLDLAPLAPSYSSSAGGTQSHIGGYKSKKARFGNKPVKKWQWVMFTNEARTDNLQLGHWRPVEESGAEDQEKSYAFAHFNKVLDLPTYTDDEYNAALTSNDWTREETDHLMELCRRFDLRWPIIIDRWEGKRFTKTRSMEDLKERYYNLCNKLTKHRNPVDVDESKLFRFDAEHERRRKEQLIKLWNRTPAQIKEEQQLVQQLKRIEARKRERDRKAQDLQKLITASDRAPASPAAVSLAAAAALMKQKKSNIGPSASTARLGGTTPATSAQTSADSFVGIRFPEHRAVGPHLRSVEMKLPSIGQKKQKAVEQALDQLKLEHFQPATESISRTFNELRSDIALLYELKSALAACEYELETLRHQYQANTGQDFDIPARIRVTNAGMDNDDFTTSSRIVTNVMDLGLGTQVPPQRKRKSVIETQPVMKRLSRRLN